MHRNDAKKSQPTFKYFIWRTGGFMNLFKERIVATVSWVDILRLSEMTKSVHTSLRIKCNACCVMREVIGGLTLFKNATCHRAKRWSFHRLILHHGDWMYMTAKKEDVRHSELTQVVGELTKWANKLPLVVMMLAFVCELCGFCAPTDNNWKEKK